MGQQEVIEALKGKKEWLGTKEIGEILGKDPSHINVLTKKLAEQGVLMVKDERTIAKRFGTLKKVYKLRNPKEW
jgi:predicted transcriptional regulator